ncbi:MAG: hypothetical protein ACRD0U_19330 [Acidimicrobiales bacterium]
MVVLVLGGVEVASWPLVVRGRPDLSVVDGLARLQLAARRNGCSIRLGDASVELSGLLDFLGLGDVVPGVADLRLEAIGEPEGGEQVGVEEVVMPHDPVA